MLRSKAALPVILVVLLLPSLMFLRRAHFALPESRARGTLFAPVETTPNRFRTYLWLDGRWQFEADGARSWVRVPHSWNHMPGLAARPGPFRYVLRFSVPNVWRDYDARLHFRGVAATARVRLNGKVVGFHAGRYTPFSFDVGPLLRYGRPNELTVDVDARATGVPPRAFGPDGDGGIFREVFLERLPRSRFDTVRLVNTPDNFGGVQLTILAEVQLPPGVPALVMGRVESSGDGSSAAYFQTRIEGGAGGRAAFRWSGVLPDLKPWSPESPHLYRASLVLVPPDGKVDGYTTSFGVRNVEWAGDRIAINGRPIRLHGAVRHADMPGGWGIVETEPAMAADIQSLREAGLNAVLLPSPPHPRFLELCDDAGVGVIESLPVHISRGNETKALASAQEQLREMIERDVNRPSVLAWGVRVTGDASPAALRNVCKRLSELAANLDARPLLMEPWFAGKGPVGNLPALLMRIDMRDRSAADEILRLRASQLPVLVVVRSPYAAAGRIGLDGRRGTEADQLGALRVFEKTARETRPAGWFVESLADYRLPAAALGPAPFLSADGLLDISRQPKQTYDWLRLPSAHASGFELHATRLPYDPPGAVLLLLVVCILGTFILWSGFGELDAMLAAPWLLTASYTTPIEISSSDEVPLRSALPLGPPIALSFLRRGLPILVCSAVGLSLAAGAFLQCHTLNLDVFTFSAATHIHRMLTGFLPRTYMIFAALLAIELLSAAGASVIARDSFLKIFESFCRCTAPLMFAAVAFLVAPYFKLFIAVLVIFWALACVQTMRCAARTLPAGPVPVWVAIVWLVPGVVKLVFLIGVGVFDFLP